MGHPLGDLLGHDPLAVEDGARHVAGLLGQIGRRLRRRGDQLRGGAACSARARACCWWAPSMAAAGRNVTTDTASTMAAVRRSWMYMKRSG